MSNLPQTKGALGIATFRTITSDPRPRPVPEVTFDWTPKSTTFSYTSALGNVYPQSGQPTEKYTSTNQELTFTASVRSPIGDFVTAYEWDFGDGSKGYGLAVTHTFLTASPATRVVLSVTDNHGRRFSQGQYMNLRPGDITIVGGFSIINP